MLRTKSYQENDPFVVGYFWRFKQLLSVFEWGIFLSLPDKPESEEEADRQGKDSKQGEGVVNFLYDKEIINAVDGKSCQPSA